MKIIACYSNKGGVGKTASSVNLAHACAQKGYTTLLCDLDPQGASGFYFRVKPSKKLKEDQFFTDEERFTESIRGSDYDGLDLLPANMSYRDFDIFLANMKKSRSRLKKTLMTLDNEYDIIILDCPPNISRLSENIFKVADKVIVPVIPTTLSERTLGQLYDFFKEKGFNQKNIVPFFSMVQKSKSLHAESMARLRRLYPHFLKTSIPSCTDIERMGIHRAPVLTYARSKSPAEAYRTLWDNIEKIL